MTLVMLSWIPQTLWVCSKKNKNKKREKVLILLPSSSSIYSVKLMASTWSPVYIWSHLYLNNIFYNVLRDYHLNTRWQSSWARNTLKIFRKLQDCFESFLNGKQFSLNSLCLFTIMLLFYSGQLWASPHQLMTPPPHCRETSITEKQAYSSPNALNSGHETHRSCYSLQNIQASARYLSTHISKN